MTFSPTITIESLAIPGVSFTINRIGIARRADIDRKTLAFRQRLRELELEYPPQSRKEELLSEQLDIAKRKALGVSAEEREAVIKNDVLPIARKITEAASAEAQKKRRILDEEYGTIQEDIRCVWIKSGLVSISGGELDGITPDQFLEFGPIELAREIYDCLENGGRLAGPQAKNLLSLGISGDPELPATKDTTVESVNSTVGTYSATALDISYPASIQI